MVDKKYFNPVKIVYSNNWLASCETVLKQLHINNPLIIASNGCIRQLNLESIFPVESICSRVKPNPTVVSTQQAVDFSQKQDFDGVIAIGGGSSMDTGKAVMACLGSGLKTIGELLKIKSPYKNRVPAVFIPTTHGTGSEVTMWGTIWDMKEKEKHSISHPDLYPDIAILDGSLTLSLPLDISMITTMDALSHSLNLYGIRMPIPNQLSMLFRLLN